MQDDASADAPEKVTVDDIEQAPGEAGQADVTPPDSGVEAERVASRKELFAYGLFGVGEQKLFGSTNMLMMPVLNIGLGINPALISAMLAVKGVFDAITDPIFGHIGDNTRSRWGRRRPYILVGGLFCALIAPLLWMFNPNWDDMSIIAWVSVALLLLTVASSVCLTAYYALGIEMAPNYKERTRVVAWRTFFQKATGILNPWFPAFIVLPFFAGELHGVQVLTLIFAVLMVPLSFIVFHGTKERTHVTKNMKKEPLLTALVSAVKNIHFLKITFMYMVLLGNMAIFSIFGLYVNIYYVYGGDKLAGSKINGIAGSLGYLLGLGAVPLVTWLCNRFQKHRAMVICVVLMATGDLIKFVCLTPEAPYLQLVVPFFYVFGISGVFMVLPSMMADVVDIDELNSGQRREGMFGAASSLFMKSAQAFGAFLSGVVLNMCGFNADLGGDQLEGTFLNMRLAFSLGPSIMLLLCLFMLYKYPLTEKYMNEVHDILKVRRKEREALEKQQAEGDDAQAGSPA